MTERVDVAVVGAGIGGLTAAILLGAAGLRVLVIERGSRVGGKAGMQIIDGIEVDTGPSLLTLPGVFEQVFAAAGRDFHRVVELVRPQPAFHYAFADGTDLWLHHDPELSAAAVGHCLSAAAGQEFRDYLAHARAIWEAAAPHFVFAEAPRMGRLLELGPSRWARFTRVDALSRLEQGIGRRVRDPRLRDLFRRFATYSGSDVRQAPGTLACIAHVELVLGAYGVKGGLHALALALEEAARAVGVEFAFRSTVEEVLLERGAVVGVRIDDQVEVRTPHVVLNADADAIGAGLFGDELQRAHGRVPSGASSMSAYTGIVRARRRRGRSAHTVLFPADYSSEFVDIFDHARVPRTPAIYVCALEPAHGRAGWEEDEPLFVMINAPALSAFGAYEPSDAIRTRVLQALLARGQIQAGDEMVWWRTPGDLAREFPGSRGALYGAAFHGPWAAFRRPDNESECVKGLFLASGSAHPGGGVPLAAQSGKQAAAAILRQRGGLT